MKPLTLHLKNPHTLPVDTSPIGTEAFQAQPLSVIAATPLLIGTVRLRLDQVFEISGEDPTHIIFSNSSDRLDCIGSNLASGVIEVHGSAGAWVGKKQTGGQIHITENVGPYAACGMHDGLLRVDGNAGDWLASCCPGERLGMQGGTVWIRGNVGQRAGDRMRRGTLLIEGNAGSYLGSRMIAGTILARGTIASHLGCGMRRGTIIISNWPESPIDDFCEVQGCEIGFLRLLWDWLASLAPELSDFRQLGINATRRFGDSSVGGIGEIIVID